MMETIIVIINAISLLFFIAALVAVAVKISAKKLRADTGLFLALTIIAVIFVNTSNIFEHLNIATWLDFYEDFIEMLLPLFFVSFLNSIRLYVDIERLKKNKQKLTIMIEERSQLLKEIHHRVKNNLQVIISIINLQRDQKGANNVHERALLSMVNRIFAMAAVHESVYSANNYARIPAIEFFTKIGEQISKNNPNEVKIKQRIAYRISPNMDFPLETAVPLGILVNELISCAQRKDFQDDTSGAITVSLYQDENEAILEVRDSGEVPAGDVPPGELDNLRALLISKLAEQIFGQVSTKIEKDTTVTVRFPYKKTTQ